MIYNIMIWNYIFLKQYFESNMNDNTDLYFTWEINGKDVILINKGNSILIKNDKLFIEKVVYLICYDNIKEKVDKNKIRF